MAIWINESDCETTNIGEIGFLVCRVNHNERRRETYSLRERPAHTNQSHEARLDDWCGETNNVSVYAMGLAQVARRTKNGRCCLRRVEPTAEVLESLGYPELTPEQ